jgi:BMFP domain-containing protein YqiC
MAGAQTLNDLLRGIVDALPAGMSNVRADIEKNLRASFNSTYARFNLVTREEFDVQTEVLSRTRAKLKALEDKVTALESASLKPHTKE